MKYDERACKFNMDTGCVELLLRDGRKISIDCTGVEDALDVTIVQRSELDYLIYNDPFDYADLILNGDPEVGKTHSVMPYRKWRKKPLGGFLCEKICPAAFLAGILCPIFYKKFTPAGLPPHTGCAMMRCKI